MPFASHPGHKCPRCEAPSPHLHPAVQHEGEVEVCTDDYHLIRSRAPLSALIPKPPNTPEDQTVSDCNSFLEFCMRFGDDAAEDVLTRICEAPWSKTRDPDISASAHTHDACNHTISGSIKYAGQEFGFVIENGNNNGTVVCEWGDAETVGDYEPPEPPRFDFVPKRDDLSPAMQSVYQAWRKEAWFTEKLRGYHYDRHFQPGHQIETHYREWADKKGLRIALVAQP